ncbi:MAG: IS1096 element passenger TnpR family protein [Dysgonomonas sp.]
MIFRFLMLSDEIDDFRREIQIDADATFFDLHNAIIKSVGYKEGEMASFFLCDDDWEKDKEITLVEMDTSPEEDSYVMDGCVLNDFLEDEKQKLIYVFDYLTERAFFIELAEIITGKSLNKPVCSVSEGVPPAQFVEFENIDTKTETVDIGENFYGDEGFDMDELDSEGFDGLDNIESLPDEDFK